MDMLNKLKLTPAAAGGVQSTLTPKQAGNPPAPAQPKPEPVQPLPQSDSVEQAGIYTVLRARPEKVADGVHTHALLQGPDGKQIHIFTIGVCPEIVDGVRLTGVKLELKQQDTVVFYILRDYRVVVPEDQAA